MNVVINSLKFNNSHVDGPGIRSLVFFQGCDIHCPGCQNSSTWDIKKGKEIGVQELANIIRKNSFNKKITITGGEPMVQKEALLELLKLLDGFDIVLYTGHLESEVPESIKEKVTYLKTGPFIERLKTSIKPFVGSSNQVFEKVGK